MGAIKQVFILLMILTIIPSVYAADAIFVMSDVKSAYNLGDVLDSELEFSLTASQNIEGCSLSLEINCPEFSYTIKNDYIRLKAGKKEVITPSPVKLSKFLVEELNLFGSCHLEATLRDVKDRIVGSGLSPKFLITDNVEITLMFEKEEFLPGDRLKIEGLATKSNGDSLEGISTITFGQEYYSDVTSGKFILKLIIDDYIKSGIHALNATVLDTEGNTGKITEEVIITPVLTSLELGLNYDSFLPKDTLVISPVLYDQAGDKMKGYVQLTIISPDKAEVLNKQAVSGDQISYSFGSLAFPGDWRIIAVADGINQEFKTEEFVKVNEVSLIKAELSNSSENVIFDIINLGNVPYTKEISILFENNNGTIEKIKRLFLGVGESVSFKLTAPEGDYSISINTEEFSKTFSDISLTGKSIKVFDESGRERKSLVRNIVLLSFLVFIAFLLGTKYFREWSYRKRIESIRKEGRTLKMYLNNSEEDLEPFSMGGKNG